jgi:hypothetical protein
LAIDIDLSSFAEQNGVASHNSWRQTQSQFNGDYADDSSHWGNWYWSTASTSGLTHRSGVDVAVRQSFVQNGKLDNTQDTKYRAINQQWPVFAFGKLIHGVRLSISNEF